jgi:hypothetical protein
MATATAQREPAPLASDPVLELYASQLRRELEMVERKLRGEPPAGS